MARKSVSYKPQNVHIKSVQLDQETWDRAHELVEESGMSFSHLVRTMIMATKLNTTASLNKQDKIAK